MEEYCQNYLGVSYEQFLDDAKAYAEDSVKSDLIFFSIAKAENVDYTEEQLRAILVGYYNESQGIYSSMEAFIDDYVKIYGSHYFVNQLIRSSVAELIYHAAVKA
jgi:FKBP-type peptidyl-prolyl cis-trans isomerase (trigger factor)